MSRQAVLKLSPPFGPVGIAERDAAICDSCLARRRPADERLRERASKSWSAREPRHVFSLTV
jgi:hypothetical protein